MRPYQRVSALIGRDRSHTNHRPCGKPLMTRSAPVTAHRQQ
jgi:hypothetical protein